MKYKLFRSPGNLDKAVRKHELVAVETGKNIDDVAEALIRDVRDDLAEMPEYAHCETTAYAPEPVKSFRRVRRYRYEMMGSALVYSIVETAKTNQLRPYEYLRHILTEIPKYIYDKDGSYLDDLLPWSVNLPDNCKKTT